MVLKKKSSKLKRSAGNGNSQSKVKEKRGKFFQHIIDEEVSSASEIDEPNVQSNSDNDSKEQEETALEKKMRLAKEYLEQLKQLKEEDDSDNNKDFVGEKLKEDLLEQSGKLLRKVADTIETPDVQQIKVLSKGHRKSIACLAVSNDSSCFFSAGKDCSLIKWCLKTFKQLVVVKGGKKEGNSHTAHILCLALSTDMKFLASGAMDNLIIVWRPESLHRIHVFQGHRGSVTGLCFQRNSHQLFSSSGDRTVKVWDLEAMGYVETLYGHQDAAQSCDSFYRDRCITAGGRDGSVRMYCISFQ